MIKAIWTWDPVSSGEYRAFDEPHAYHYNKWFFDKSVWQKMFRTLGGCGFNALVLANTHPFPFMTDLERYPDAKVIEDPFLDQYRAMHSWIFDTALNYDFAPYVGFSSIYYPTKLLEARGIDPKDSGEPTDFAVEYTHYCVRRLLEEYPFLTGVFADAGGNISGKRTEFLQQAIVDALDAVRPDAALYIRGWGGEPNELIDRVKRRAGRPIRYSVEYTGEQLVDANPAPAFTKWVEAAGANNIAAEFPISNFQPWTSFSYDTVEGIVSNLDDLDCNGFSLHPLAPCEWPRCSDMYFRHQWQRDLVYYNIWGGSNTEQMQSECQPKWISRNTRVLAGFEAASRILEILALYIAGDEKSHWLPQFCMICDSESENPAVDSGNQSHSEPFGSAQDRLREESACNHKRGPRSPLRLLSINDMLHGKGSDLWTQITGDRAVYLTEYLASGTPEDAYGPDELIEELLDLSQVAVGAGEKGLRNTSGEKEIPGLSRDALCMGKLGEFYAERFRAALAHGRGDDTEALEHMSQAIALYREIAEVDTSHRTSIRIMIGREAIEWDWNATINALEAEHADAATGTFKPGADYPISAP